MKSKTLLLSALLFLSVALLSSTLALSYEGGDPRRELEDCKEKCQRRHQHEAGMRRECEQQCEEQCRRREEGERERGRDKEDPERQLDQCMQQCRERQQGQERQYECQRQCREEYEQQKGGRGRGRDDEIANPRDPERQREQCMRQCQGRQHSEEQRRVCQQTCDREYEEAKRKQGERDDKDNPHGRGSEEAEMRLHECQQRCKHQQRPERIRECQSECEEEYQREKERHRGTSPGRGREEEWGEGRSPYVFSRESFRQIHRTEHGQVKVSKPFHEVSDLLLGIANYRLAILEANPHTFVIPKHKDADMLIYVVKGRGTVSVLRHENRETYDVREGTVIRVPAGCICYCVNKDSNEKLIMAQLLQPVSTPGRFEEFFAVGGEDPQSYYKAFSNEVLEAAFNMPRDRLERLFSQQRRGAIIKASEEQIRGMSRQTSEGGQWPFAGESKRSFNLFDKRPTHSSNRGQLYEARPEDCEELRELDVQVAFANITRGSMVAPYYNSKATMLALVVDGHGYMEMVCPRLARQGQWQGQGHESEEEEGERGWRGQKYQRVRAQLSPGTVYIVPPGYPATAVASKDQNLQVMCFDIRAMNNNKNFLAGKNNVLKQMEEAAKEMAFNRPAREVDEVLNAQREAMFLPGPEERQEGGGRHHVLSSIMDFAGF